MSNNGYLSLEDAKKYVGRGFSTNFLKVSRNDFGCSLGYRLSDLDAFIAKRENAFIAKREGRSKTHKKAYVGFECTHEEFSEIENFKKINEIGYRELVLRTVRNVNK